MPQFVVNIAQYIQFNKHAHLQATLSSTTYAQFSFITASFVKEMNMARNFYCYQELTWRVALASQAARFLYIHTYI